MVRVKDFIIRGDNWAFYHLRAKGIFNKMSDEAYLKMLWRRTFHKKLNLKKPETFNEKLQWLKIHDRRQEYTAMVDKYEAKRYVAERIGEEYIIPTLGVWGSFDEIDFDSLPDQFVLKCTHDSGGLAICRDKASFDKEKARVKIERSLKRNYYWSSREWPYKDVQPRIIAEQFLEDMDELVEYKLFCFHGEVKMVLVCKGRAHSGERTNDFCDRELNRLPFTSLNPNSKGDLKVPKELPDLIAFAEKLSADMPHVRVDTYLADGKIYFGELTFFHNSGFCPFDPPHWDRMVGDWIDISKV